MSEQVKPEPKAYQANVFWDRQDCATLSAQVYLASDADSYINALHAEAEALRAENGRLRADRGVVAHAHLLRAQIAERELEAARGLIQRLTTACDHEAYGSALHDARGFITATPSPEVPDHLRDSTKMVEQGERQEAACWVPSTCLDKLRNGCNNSPAVLTDGPAEFNDTPLYAVPQPSQDVRAMVEALEPFADFIAGTDPFWSDDRRIATLNYDFSKLRLGLFRKAQAAVAPYRQAQRQA